MSDDVQIAKRLAESLRRQVLHKTGAMQFTAPLKEIPNNEYCEHAQDWNP